MVELSTSSDSPPSSPPQSQHRPLFSFPKRPALRLTSEFDSESSLFLHKVSCKLFDGLAKLKLSFQNDKGGDISEPQLSVISKHVTVHYDLEENNAFLRGSLDVTPRLQVTATHDVKAQQGELTMVANLAEPGYNFELSSPVPAIGLRLLGGFTPNQWQPLVIGYITHNSDVWPRATMKFPFGEVSLEEKEKEEEVDKMLSISGILKGQILKGICTAQYKDEDLKLRYCYKDDELSVIPTLSLPSNALSLALKRQFRPSDKLSYLYNFFSNNWSLVYKHTYDKDFKFKAGYDSEVRLSWASLWVGEEGGKAKASPLKVKAQFMLQVPQDDIRSSVLMFRVKKRFDI